MMSCLMPSFMEIRNICSKIERQIFLFRYLFYFLRKKMANVFRIIFVLTTLNLSGKINEREVYCSKHLDYKSVGATELHFSSKKREHSLTIPKSFFVRHSPEYYPAFHTLTSVGRKKLFSILKKFPCFIEL